MNRWSARSPALLVVVTGLVAASCNRNADGGTAVVRVLTDRTASHLETIIAYYEKSAGVKVETNYIGDGLLARLEARPEEADLVITKNAELLELAKRKGLLAPISSYEVVDNIPRAFRDPDSSYVVLSFRARAIFYAKGRVKPAEIATYQDLASPRFHGRVCMRSGFHEYNVSWLTQMAVSEGLPATTAFIEKLRDNLARPPQGDDRAQVRALLENVCDVAVANSYYMGVMLQSDEQKAWAEASEVIFPDQAGRGSYVMRDAAALTKSKSAAGHAAKLLDFLTGDMAQHYFSEALFEYPTRPGVPLAPLNLRLGGPQGIVGGAYKVNLVSLSEAVNQRQAILDALTRLNFDRQ